MEAVSLIRTKLQRPIASHNLLPRSQLVQRLEDRRQRKLTLVSAPAGYGKSTLVNQWLETYPTPTAWLSLDENDRDLATFLSYVVAAIQTIFPEACSATAALLRAPQLPPLDYVTTTLSNDLADLPDPFLLVLDDYHLVNQKQINQLVSALIQYQSPHLHLVIATRHDPLFSLARLRARQAVTEIRWDDLRFTVDEAGQYLAQTLDTPISSDIIAKLVERTEGWAAGLRLAALAMRHQMDYAAFVDAFHGNQRYIMEYLLEEVLSHQPQAIQTFLRQISILDRFCAPLCDALTGEALIGDAGLQAGLSSEAILAQLEHDNFFLIPLDQSGEWFRYHQLLKDLLNHKLKTETTPEHRTLLHTRAAVWLEQSRLAAEALPHFLAANNTDAAVALLDQQYYSVINQGPRQRLLWWLDQFSPKLIDQHPKLLMLKAWEVFNRGQTEELPVALDRVEAVMARTSLTPDATRHLQGEISALRSLVSLFAVDLQSTMTYVRQALEKLHPDLWGVRILVRLHVAAVRQMKGDLPGAYAAVYDGLKEEPFQNSQLRATLLMTVCYIHWLEADLQSMAQAADESRALSRKPSGWVHHFLGSVAYHQNDLATAEQHFAVVAKQRYLHAGQCVAHSIFGLALTYQAQGRSDEAWRLAGSAISYALKMSNTALLPVAQAFQAELALRQGQNATASQWAAQFDPIPSLQPMFRFYVPHFTLVKVWLAQNTPASRQQAGELLSQLREFVEFTHNTRFFIDGLALQALLLHAEGDKPNALAALEQALTLAQPGGFIRLFVDLGPQMALLLAELKTEDSGLQSYIDQILAACPADLPWGEEKITPPQADIPELIDPLTGREMDVLTLLAQRRSDQEIAEQLVISPTTVRFHTRNIYTKLHVHSRRQAVARAGELGLVPPS